MLQAYLDDSGTHGDSKFCVVAGYVGGVRRWGEFERRWRTVLDREGVEEFHAKEFWGRKKGKRVGIYKDWTDYRADNFLCDLLDIFEQTDVYPVGAGIVVSEWKKLNDNERRWVTGAQASFNRGKFFTSGSTRKPYFVPLHHCIYNPTKHCKSHLKVHFVVDKNKQLEAWAVRIFNDLQTRTDWGAKLGDMTFSNSKEARGLQCADLLAYQIYQYGLGRLVNPRLEPNIVLKSTLLKARSLNDFKLYDERSLGLFLREFRTSFAKTVDDNESMKRGK